MTAEGSMDDFTRRQLVEFVRTRLDDDERRATTAAQVAGDANWTSGDLSDSIYAGDSGRPVVDGPYGYLADELKAYLVINDPVRALAEVAFKRDLLRWCERCLFWDDGEPIADDWDTSVIDARWMLRSIAALYTNHLEL